MKKKDFETISSVIRAYLDDGDYGVEKLARRLAYILSIRYEKFDSKKFLTGCGLDPEL